MQMPLQPWLALALAQDHQRREAARVAIEAQVREGRPSIRRAVGRRIIAIGERLAADPALELARSR